MSIVLGTAGHIDHGKTALVKALTGVDCDRLEEEKRRGITIELGFAALELGEGHTLGIVDVPGHEKFIKNMVAGASGIDVVMLVIAADEGVMPQTREHLEICTLLGIKHGLIALTKIDSVDKEMIELAKEDAQEFVAGSALENAPIFPVSAFTGEGISELRQYLLKLSDSLKSQQKIDLFRLPVDRVFTIKGHGTVVTGTSISGSAAIGTELAIYPKNTMLTRIRSVQTHGKSVEVAEAGKRTSLNLANCTLEDVERGNVLAYPNSLFPTAKWLVRLTCLSTSPQPISHRKEIHLHHAATELMAKIYLFHKQQLMPGETALAEIRYTPSTRSGQSTSTPLVGVFGDHLVIRSSSPLRTVAGGVILMPTPYSFVGSDFSPELQKEILKLYDYAQSDPKQLVLMQIELAKEQGRNFNELMVLTSLSSKQLEKQLVALMSQNSVQCYNKELKAYIATSTAQKLSDTIITLVKEFHKKEPLKQGIIKNTLLSAKTLNLEDTPEQQKLATNILEKLVKSKELATNGEVYFLPSFTISLAKDEEKLQKDLMKIINKTPYAPPSIKEINEELNISPKELQPILKLLLEQKKLTKINENFYYSAAIIQELEQKIRGHFAKTETLDPATFKELSGGLSRKYSIPILEYFDMQKVTLRVGDIRKLRR